MEESYEEALCFSLENITSSIFGVMNASDIVDNNNRLVHFSLRFISYKEKFPKFLDDCLISNSRILADGRRVT